MKKFLVVDDHPLFRDALRSVVRAELPDAEIHEATEIDAALDMIAGQRRGYDLVLFDLMLPGTTGFGGLVQLVARFPTQPVLIVSALDDPKLVEEALSLGASGFVSKAASKKELGKAIIDVLDGRSYRPSNARLASTPRSEDTDLISRLSELTPQQMRVLHLIRQGKLNKQIAYELGVSETTVKAHVSEVLHKMNVSSRTQVVIETQRLDFDAFREEGSHQDKW